MTGLSDSFQRPINYLRVSVTDRCSLRCIYCMPPEGVPMLSHDDILTYEEIFQIVRTAADLGIDRIRLTGGEPLVRLQLSQLVRMIAGIKTITDISLTTNGLLLAKYAAELKQAGLKRVNVSLDTLDQAKFELMTRGKYKVGEVLAGIEAAKAAGLNPVKINMVVIAGTNDNEIVDFARKTIDEDWHVRFIEYMPFTSTSTANASFVSVREMKRKIAPLGKLEPCKTMAGNGPARYFRLPGSKGTIGFITPVSEHFCFQCNRLRLTADGKLRPCLLCSDEIDLRQALRSGTPEKLKELIEHAVSCKPLRHHLAEGQIPRDRPFCQVGG